MNQQLPELNPWALAAIALFGSCVLASGATWIWAIVKLIRREPLLLPDAKAIAAGESLLSDALDRDLGTVSPLSARSKVLAWRGATMLAVLGLYYLLQFGVGAVFFAVRHGRGQGKPDLSSADMLLTLIFVMTVSNLLFIVLSPVVIRAISGHTLRDLGLWPSWRLLRDVRAGIIAFLLVGPVVYAVFALAQTIWAPSEHPISQSIKEQGAASSAALAMIAAAIAAPIAEELLFRGVLLGWLMTIVYESRSRLLEREARRHNQQMGGDPSLIALEFDNDRNLVETRFTPATGYLPSPSTFWLVNLLVSLVFAVLHSPQWPAPLALLLLALVLGWLVYRTGRLMASIVLHAAFNCFSTVMLLLVTQAYPNLGK